jgi:hypothetical protein
VHSGHDVADLRSGDSAGCVAILGEPEPLERVVASDDRRCLARAVGGARRDRTQKDAFARDQELAFALERSELERQALDSRTVESATRAVQVVHALTDPDCGRRARDCSSSPRCSFGCGGSAAAARCRCSSDTSPSRPHLARIDDAHPIGAWTGRVPLPRR